MTVEELRELQREEAIKRMAARAFIRDTVMVVLFSVVIFSLSYVSRDSRDFDIHESIQNNFVAGNMGFKSAVRYT